MSPATAKEPTVTNLPAIKGIAFNPKRGEAATGFVALYDPTAVHFARRLNFALVIVLTLAFGGGGLLLLQHFAPPVADDDGSASSGALFLGLLFSFVLPLLLACLALIAALLTAPKLGFDLPRVYALTANELRSWLPEEAGAFPAMGEKLMKELKESFGSLESAARSVTETDSESTLLEAAASVARGESEVSILISREHIVGRLVRNEDSSYSYVGNA